jgi:hypothetical protein
MASEDRKTAREDARLDAEAARLASAEADGTDPGTQWGDFRPTTF